MSLAPASRWTIAREAQLKALWERGDTCSQIAAEMGDLTRSAVIGKVHRMRLNGRNYSNGPVQPKLSPEERRQLKNERRNLAERLRRQNNPHAYSFDAARKREKRRKEALSVMRSSNARTTSAEYRKHLPKIPEMTRNELREMFAQAVQNTAAMGVT